MSRNLKVAYIRKLAETEAPNGYKFDIENYIYNPSYSYDYPSFKTIIAEDETTETIRRVYYFKHYDGTGEYLAETYKLMKNGGKWQVAKETHTETLENSNRFNLNKLLSFCVE